MAGNLGFWGKADCPINHLSYSSFQVNIGCPPFSHFDVVRVQQREAMGSALPIPTVTVPNVTTKEAVIIYSFCYVYLYPDLVHEKCVVPQGSFCDKSWLSSVFVFK